MKAITTALVIGISVNLIPVTSLAAKTEKKEEKKDDKKKKGNPKASFKQLDKDNDGFLTKEEFAGLGSSGDPANFTHLDTNKDGKLDAAEFAKK